jgi:hypothetical protein
MLIPFLIFHDGTGKTYRLCKKEPTNGKCDHLKACMRRTSPRSGAHRTLKPICTRNESPCKGIYRTWNVSKNISFASSLLASMHDVVVLYLGDAAAWAGWVLVNDPESSSHSTPWTSPCALSSNLHEWRRRRSASKIRYSPLSNARAQLYCAPRITMRTRRRIIKAGNLCEVTLSQYDRWSRVSLGF